MARTLLGPVVTGSDTLCYSANIRAGGTRPVLSLWPIETISLVHVIPDKSIL